MDLQGQRVYLGGPLDGAGPGPELYEEATRRLESWGAQVASPRTFRLAEDIPGHPEDPRALAEALDADSRALLHADLVLLLPGGDAVAETMAATFGLPVASLLPAVPEAREPRVPVQRTAPASLPSELSSPQKASR